MSPRISFHHRTARQTNFSSFIWLSLVSYYSSVGAALSIRTRDTRNLLCVLSGRIRPPSNIKARERATCVDAQNCRNLPTNNLSISQWRVS